MRWRWGRSKSVDAAKAKVARPGIAVIETEGIPLAAHPQWTPELQPMRAMIDCLPIAACLRDRSGVLFHCNIEFEQLSGFNPRNSEHRDYAWLDSAECERACLLDHRLLQAGGRQREVEHVVDLQCGRRRRCDVQRSALRDANGQIAALFSVYQPQPEAPSSAERSTATVNDALFADLSPDAWLRCDPSGRLRACNAACKRLLNLDPTAPEESLQMVERMVPLPHRARLLSWLSQVAVGDGEAQRVRMRLLRPDDSEFAAEITLKAVTANDLAMTVRDIDEHHQLALGLDESNRHLRRLRRRLELAVRGSGYGIWEFDLHTGHIVWDPQMYVIHGQMPGDDDFDGSVESWAGAVHADDQCRMRKRFEEASRGRESLGFVYRIRRWQQTAVRYIESNCFAERDDHGEVIRLVGMDRDVTGRIEADMELKILNTELENLVSARTHELIEAKDHAEAASRAKSEFLANISHELRTPLHSILGFARLSLEDDQYLSPEERLTFLHRISASGENLLRLVDDLLDSARIEAEKLALAPVSTDLSVVVRQVLDEFGAMLRESGLQLQVGLVERAALHCDPARIAQAVRNLLSNACKFAPRESRVEVSLFGTPAGWAVRVRDYGPGVPIEEQDKIFDKFTQSSITTTGAGGAGLGLPIARGIARLHGGDLVIEPVDGAGACFCLTLPASAASE